MNKNGTSHKKIDCLRNGSEKLKRNWISITYPKFLKLTISKAEKTFSPIGGSINDKFYTFMIIWCLLNDIYYYVDLWVNNRRQTKITGISIK